jgi:hypothetical protein
MYMFDLLESLNINGEKIENKKEREREREKKK